MKNLLCFFIIFYHIGFSQETTIETLKQQGVQLSEKTNNTLWLPKFYEMQGRMHANLLQLDSATLFFNKAIKGYKVIDNKKGEATTLFKLAWVDRKNGRLENALQKDLSGFVTP